jgi:hypothetical protein
MPAMMASTILNVSRFRSADAAGAGGNVAPPTGNRSLGTGSPQRGHVVRGMVGDAVSGGSSALQ